MHRRDSPQLKSSHGAAGPRIREHRGGTSSDLPGPQRIAEQRSVAGPRRSPPLHSSAAHGSTQLPSGALAAAWDLKDDLDPRVGITVRMLEFRLYVNPGTHDPDDGDEPLDVAGAPGINMGKRDGERGRFLFARAPLTAVERARSAHDAITIMTRSTAAARFIAPHHRTRPRWSPLTRCGHPLTTLQNVAALPSMLEHDRKRAGWSVGQAAWRLGVSIRGVPGARGRRTLAELGDVRPDLQAVRLAPDVHQRRLNLLALAQKIAKGLIQRVDAGLHVLSVQQVGSRTDPSRRAGSSTNRDHPADP